MRSVIYLMLGGLLALNLTGCALVAVFQEYQYKVAVAAGVDGDTDAIGGGVELQMNDGNQSGEQAIRQPAETLWNPKPASAASNLSIVPGVFYGRGSQDFGDFDPLTGEILSYSVLEIGVRGQYAVSLSDDGLFQAYPLAGPAFYRFSYSDCPFDDFCSENLFLFDVGAGVRYGNFGLEASTALGGPNFRIRLKYAFVTL